VVLLNIVVSGIVLTFIFKEPNTDSKFVIK